MALDSLGDCNQLRLMEFSAFSLQGAKSIGVSHCAVHEIIAVLKTIYKLAIREGTVYKRTITQSHTIKDHLVEMVVTKNSVGEVVIDKPGKFSLR